MYGSKRIPLFSVVVPLLFAASVVVAAPSNLIVNGSFEDASKAPPYATELRLRAGSTVIKGWTVTGDGVDYMGTRWAPAEGQRSVDLNRDAAGGIRCDRVQTKAGQLYDLIFDMAGNPDPAPPLRTLAVLINDTQVRSFTFDATGVTATDMRWTQHRVRFRSASDQTSIGFVSQTSEGRGPMLDNIRLYRGNHPPSAPTSLSIIPASPRGGQALHVSVSGSADADRDPITYLYAWEKSTDGGRTWSPGPEGCVVASGMTARGELWRFRVRACDWLDSSRWVTSEAVAIP